MSKFVMSLDIARYANVLHFPLENSIPLPNREDPGCLVTAFCPGSPFGCPPGFTKQLSMKKEKNAKEDTIKTLRFNSEEWAIIEANMLLSNYKMFSRYAKNKLLNNQYGDRNVSKREREKHKKIAEFSRIGNNVNQIAKKINSINNPIISFEDRQLLRALLRMLELNIKKVSGE